MTRRRQLAARGCELVRSTQSRAVPERECCKMRRLSQPLSRWTTLSLSPHGGVTADGRSLRTQARRVHPARADRRGWQRVVYRCEQPQLRRSAVVKVLDERGLRSDAALDRFRREAQLASQLDHPYAAHVYAFGDEDDGLFWFAMELVQGTALDDWLEARGPMTLAQFVPFFECVADVVHAAHEREIIHRDLKPSNVMVIDRNGRLSPKLLAFGIAKLPGEPAPPLSEHSAGDEVPTT